ncbi:hypothetical protein EIN_328850 [Entamoeba invadens IP1]|uniref:Uncharacterized protein n=1 Tax=Entamoeba invadens IP1 TaxID=370355 RepID=A0A0A1U109_ENTIV|nr:hypothetical protein EIN_328850 [Entamoeba invadens IP1]ELP86178.1 hypothetical protein EIN_328850 [Entamoeba invadens IP1]|eukprot:XP_004185524.1 hypothetical protein EIN_328850 [Entamoeba invadens IP1]
MVIPLLLLISLSHALTYPSTCQHDLVSSFKYVCTDGGLYLYSYIDLECTAGEQLVIQDPSFCTQHNSTIYLEHPKENRHDDKTYCESKRRKHIVYGLAIGYPFSVLALTAIVLGMGRRIPVINIFLSPFVFSALVCMIDRLICKQNDFEVIVASGVFVSTILIELIVIFIARIFYRDTDTYHRIFAAHSILMELWNGSFDHDLNAILTKYLAQKPDGHVVGEAYHYITKILKHKESEYQQIDDEEDEHFVLLTKTTFKTTQRISYKSWEKETQKIGKIPKNAMLRVTIEENIRLTPEMVKNQNEVFDKIREICKTKDTHYSLSTHWGTPYIYKSLCVIQSPFLDFLLSWKLFGMLYVVSMMVGLNLFVDVIWRFLETPFKFRIEKTVSIENNLPYKW